MKTILACSLLALAGCATVGAAPAADSYRAHGTEPFWSLTVANGRIRYEAPDLDPLETAAPQPRPTFNGHRYETAEVIVDITHGRCNDGMGERDYADTVRVIFPGGGRTLEGCGGAALPPERLAGTAWSIVGIGGDAVSGEMYALQFTEDRISGRAGCNRFTGGFTESSATLTTGPLAMTRMACPGPGMAHERRVGEILGGPVQMSFPDGDTLVLTGANGEIRLRRVI